MNSKRYNQLMSEESGTLTAAEMREGWHFCPEWDYLLTCLEEGEPCGCSPWTEDEIQKTEQPTDAKRET